MSGADRRRVLAKWIERTAVSVPRNAAWFSSFGVSDETVVCVSIGRLDCLRRLQEAVAGRCRCADASVKVRTQKDFSLEQENHFKVRQHSKELLVL
jgi:hypothetical protein